MGYLEEIDGELKRWKAEMTREPSFLAAMSKRLQQRINAVIPERVHQAITVAIKQMVRGVLLGAELTATRLPEGLSPQVRDHLALERITFYSRAAAAEGAVTGAGGILLSLADFPAWLSLKMKMLYEIAAAYGADVGDYRERVFLLHVFQLAFSGAEHRRNVFALLERWDNVKSTLPDDMNAFDWRKFQQEYRDYIDIAKLLQLIPGVGAVVGAYVNHRLTARLGRTAMNAYRMRMAERRGDLTF